MRTPDATVLANVNALSIQVEQVMDQVGKLTAEGWPEGVPWVVRDHIEDGWRALKFAVDQLEFERASLMGELAA